MRDHFVPRPPSPPSLSPLAPRARPASRLDLRNSLLTFTRPSSTSPYPWLRKISQLRRRPFARITKPRSRMAIFKTHDRFADGLTLTPLGSGLWSDGCPEIATLQYRNEPTTNPIDSTYVRSAHGESNLRRCVTVLERDRRAIYRDFRPADGRTT